MRQERGSKAIILMKKPLGVGVDRQPVARTAITGPIWISILDQ